MVTISSDVQTSFHSKLAQGSAKPPLNFKIASLRIRGGGGGGGQGPHSDILMIGGRVV